MLKTFKIQYVHSPTGCIKRQKETIRSLGLKRLNEVREVPDHPTVRGMVRAVSHLVKILEG